MAVLRHIRKLLRPVGWLYGIGVDIRNLCFDTGLLKSRTFDVPVICIGNITVGGTGKTPHTEYLIRLLNKDRRVAVLSRGYKRKTKGFQLAGPHSTPYDIGDEPCQMKHKFPDVTVAVDSDRCHGIEMLTNRKMENEMPDIILLDDAYQHRYVKPRLSILLMDYSRMPYDDHMLPSGDLREGVKHVNRADIIIITKCPESINPTEKHGLERAAGTSPWQKVFFSRFAYRQLVSISNRSTIALNDVHDYCILLVTGIANPAPLIDMLEKDNRCKAMTFNDHHDYTEEDIERMKEEWQRIRAEKRIIITTEKDAAKLKAAMGKGCRLEEFMYVIPVEVEFLEGQDKEFDKIIQSI